MIGLYLYSFNKDEEKNYEVNELYFVAMVNEQFKKIYIMESENERMKGKIGLEGSRLAPLEQT